MNDVLPHLLDAAALVFRLVGEFILAARVSFELLLVGGCVLTGLFVGLLLVIWNCLLAVGSTCWEFTATQSRMERIFDDIAVVFEYFIIILLILISH